MNTRRQVSGPVGSSWAFNPLGSKCNILGNKFNKIEPVMVQGTEQNDDGDASIRKRFWGSFPFSTESKQIITHFPISITVASSSSPASSSSSYE